MLSTALAQQIASETTEAIGHNVIITDVRGMDVTFVTTADDDERGRALLAALGMPFAGGRS
jgi:ribosomal protein L5